MRYNDQRPSRYSAPRQAEVVPLHVVQRLDSERRRLAQELAAANERLRSMGATQDRLVHRVRSAESSQRELQVRVDTLEAVSEGHGGVARALEAEVEALRAQVEETRSVVQPWELPVLCQPAIVRLGDVHDSVQRALDASEGADGPWRDGYARIGDQVRGVLTAAGVQLVGRPGDVFDPHVHAAVGTVPAGAQAAGQVESVLGVGLRSVEGTLIRPAQVMVAQ
jgi:molecular chaperone GrpE (heat shock protein)